MQRLVNGELVDMTQEEIDEMQQEQAAATSMGAWAGYQEAARAALGESDITVLRCVESGVTVPASWAAYRKALREIVGAQTGDATQPLPAKPAYPAGT